MQIQWYGMQVVVVVPRLLVAGVAAMVEPQLPLLRLAAVVVVVPRLLPPLLRLAAVVVVVPRLLLPPLVAEVAEALLLLLRLRHLTEPLRLPLRPLVVEVEVEGLPHLLLPLPLVGVLLPLLLLQLLHKTKVSSTGILIQLFYNGFIDIGISTSSNQKPASVTTRYEALQPVVLLISTHILT